MELQLITGLSFLGHIIAPSNHLGENNKETKDNCYWSCVQATNIFSYQLYIFYPIRQKSEFQIQMQLTINYRTGKRSVIMLLPKTSPKKIIDDLSPCPHLHYNHRSSKLTAAVVKSLSETVISFLDKV